MEGADGSTFVTVNETNTKQKNAMNARRMWVVAAVTMSLTTACRSEENDIQPEKSQPVVVAAPVGSPKPLPDPHEEYQVNGGLSLRNPK